MTGVNSDFAECWFDKSDAQSRISTILDEDQKLGHALDSFVNNGFFVLEGVIPGEQIDQYLEEFQKLKRDRSCLKASDGRDICMLADVDTSKHGTKILDTVSIMASAQNLALNSEIVKYLRILLDDDPLAFQSLHFEVGSTQAIHQDTAYVVVDVPNSLVATWIALEDVRFGAGELIYIPGSHRLADFKYGDGWRKFWKPEIDGHEIHNHHLWWLKNLHPEELGREVMITSFYARKGDVLFWHADLAHGGAPSINRRLTRKSLVTHYTGCRNTPRYFQQIPVDLQTKLRVGGSFLSSSVYDLRRSIYS